jgi:hypothetical protein
MKTINIKTDSLISRVPFIIPFQGAPTDNFAHGEEILVQLVNNEGDRVGQPEIRSVVKTHDAEEKGGAWYEAFIPTKKV